MKLNKPLFILASTLLLVGCANSPSTASSEATSEATSQGTEQESSEATSEATSETSSDGTSEASSEDSSTSIIDQIKAAYGQGTITSTSQGASQTYDETTKTWTLAVAADKAKYTLTGFFEHIVISDVNNLGENNYKGVILSFAKAAIISETSFAPISYTCEKKNVQIDIASGTNMVYAWGTDDNATNAIDSENNVEFSGVSTDGASILISSYGGHAVKGKGDISIYGSPNITISNAEKDAFHSDKFLTDNNGKDTFSGSVSLVKAGGDFIEATTDAYDGYTSITGGTFTVTKCENVIRTDVSCTVGAGASITATATGKAVTKQKNATAEPTVSVTSGATFKVNGEDVTSTQTA